MDNRLPPIRWQDLLRPDSPGKAMIAIFVLTMLALLLIILVDINFPASPAPA